MKDLSDMLECERATKMGVGRKPSSRSGSDPRSFLIFLGKANTWTVYISHELTRSEQLPLSFSHLREASAPMTISIGHEGSGRTFRVPPASSFNIHLARPTTRTDQPINPSKYQSCLLPPSPLLMSRPSPEVRCPLPVHLARFVRV
jgi:hypothetical protein